MQPELMETLRHDESFGEYQEEIWDHIDWNHTVKVEPKGERAQQ